MNWQCSQKCIEIRSVKKIANYFDKEPKSVKKVTHNPKPPMPDPAELSRRERQIMDILFARSEATVNQICAELPDPPTPMAVRRMLHILEEKGFLNRRELGREVAYSPREKKEAAGSSAFQRVLETFFGGSLEDALSAHLLTRKDTVTTEEQERLIKLIEEARKEGR